MSSGDRADLAGALADLVEAGAMGVQLRVHDDLGDWTGSAGLAQRGGTAPVSTEGRFRIGSVTKTFVAAVTVMLAGDGALDLDDPVLRHLPGPGLGLDERITVRMLLMHLSGVPNYSGDHSSDGSSSAGVFPTNGPDYVRDLETEYAPDDLVRFALARPAPFAPGTGFLYSNTNYLLIQLVIEAVTGRSYADEVVERIVAPLGLRDTLVPLTRTDIPGPHAHGYFAYRPDGAGELAVVDVSRSSPTWYGAAGSIISTTADLDTFLEALLRGGLLAPPLLDEVLGFVPPPPAPGVGIGLFRQELGEGRFGIGHFGSIPGYLCYLYGTSGGAARMAMSVTRGPVDRFDPDAVSAFMAATDRAVRTCFSALRTTTVGASAC